MRFSKLFQKPRKLLRALGFGAVIFKVFDDIKICVAPENEGDIRASDAVPQVALNSRGSLDVGWDMTDYRKRGAPSGSVNFVFVSCGTSVHPERHCELTCGITRIAEGYETVHWSTGVDQVFLHRGFSFIFPC